MGEISNTRSKPRPNTNRVENHNGRDCAVAYGIEPGAAQRLDPTKRIWLEQSPTLRANAGDNQASVGICNFKADGAIGGGIAFAIVGDHENRPTDMTNLVVEKCDDEDTDREEILPLGRG